MKRIISLFAILVLFGGLSLQAAPVSKSRAMDIAKKVFAAQPATKSAGDVKLLWDGEDIATKSNLQPAFYVFTRDGGGFVIIAGDDNVQPVLAVSDHNEFRVEGMPDNVKWWMEGMKAYVRGATEPTAAIRSQWSRFTATKASDVITEGVTPVVSHFTPEWDQGNSDLAYGFGKNVFNAKCPTDAGGKTLTGCVATALGEVLTYQSGQDGVTMPTAAHGTIVSYEPQAGFVTPEFPYVLGKTYDWAGLRTLTNIAAVKAAALDPTKTALIDNLGQLLADLGAMMEADYSSKGTGAITSKAPEKLGTYLDFNKGACTYSAGNYSNRQWIELLKEEIDNRPIIYSGTDPDDGGGHAFVFDGYGTYNEETVFHVNFGWGGYGNGYYYNTAIDYRLDCAAIFNLYPATGPSNPVYALQFANHSNTIPGVMFEDPFQTDDSVMILMSVQNVGSITYNGKLKAELVDKNNKFKADIPIYTGDGWTDTFENVPFGMIYADYFLLVVPEAETLDPKFGDKIIISCTTNAEQTIFAPIRTLNDGSVCNSLAIMPAAFIVTKDSYNAGDWFSLELENYDYFYKGTVWTITEPDGNQVVKKQSDREFKLTQKGTYKIEAAVAPFIGSNTVETIVTYITVN